MPELKWTSPQATEQGREYLVFASQLPAAGLRSVPAFLSHTMRINRQLREAMGLVGYSQRADLVRYRWTLSVWHDEASLRAFVQAEPHASTMRALARYTREPMFATWNTDSPVPLPTWEEVSQRLTAQLVNA